MTDFIINEIYNNYKNKTVYLKFSINSLVGSILSSPDQQFDIGLKIVAKTGLYDKKN